VCIAAATCPLFGAQYIKQEVGWTPEQVYKFWRRRNKYLGPVRIRTPDSPAHIWSGCRLRYHGFA